MFQSATVLEVFVPERMRIKKKKHGFFFSNKGVITIKAAKSLTVIFLIGVCLWQICCVCTSLVGQNNIESVNQ